MRKSPKVTQKSNEAPRNNTQQKPVPLSDAINIAIAFLTLCSVIGVFVTIFEMRADRNAAYMPTILMNPIENEISWDTNGKEEWFINLNVKSDFNTSIDEDGNVSVEFHWPMAIFPEDHFESFFAVNIGVGTAKDILFRWNPDNIDLLFDYLVKCEPAKSELLYVDRNCGFYYDEMSIITNLPQDMGLMYMLPDAAETYTLELPMAYSILIHEIIKSSKYDKSNPPFFLLTVDYQDVQGQKKSDSFVIVINRTLYRENTNGSGNAKYQLIFQHSI